jgi:hypothetical protein
LLQLQGGNMLLSVDLAFLETVGGELRVPET